MLFCSLATKLAYQFWVSTNIPVYQLLTILKTNQRTKTTKMRKIIIFIVICSFATYSCKDSETDVPTFLFEIVEEQESDIVDVSSYNYHGETVFLLSVKDQFSSDYGIAKALYNKKGYLIGLAYFSMSTHLNWSPGLEDFETAAEFTALLWRNGVWYI